MYVCMYIYTYIMYICTYIHLHTINNFQCLDSTVIHIFIHASSVHRCTDIRTNIYIYVQYETIYIYTCVPMYIDTYARMHTYMYMCVRMCVCIYFYIYPYTYVRSVCTQINMQHTDVWHGRRVCTLYMSINT